MRVFQRPDSGAVVVPEKIDYRQMAETIKTNRVALVVFVGVLLGVAWIIHRATDAGGDE